MKPGIGDRQRKKIVGKRVRIDRVVFPEPVDGCRCAVVENFEVGV